MSDEIHPYLSFPVITFEAYVKHGICEYHVLRTEIYTPIKAKSNGNVFRSASTNYEDN